MKKKEEKENTSGKKQGEEDQDNGTGFSKEKSSIWKKVCAE